MTWQGLWLQLHTFLGDINSQLKQKRFCNPLQFFTKEIENVISQLNIGLVSLYINF